MLGSVSVAASEVRANKSVLLLGAALIAATAAPVLSANLSSTFAGLSASSPATSASAKPAAPQASAAALAERRQEMQCLAQAVYFEARGESLAGQQAVAQVILNRVHAPQFPKSVCQVVYQGAARRTGCQFSFACNGAMKRTLAADAWDRAQAVAGRALSGFIFRGVGLATHYHTVQVSPTWSRRMHKLAQIGAHIFYAPQAVRGLVQAAA